MVMGLVSTKTPVLEDEDELVRRLDEAARHLPLEQLALAAVRLRLRHGGQRDRRRHAMAEARARRARSRARLGLAGATAAAKEFHAHVTTAAPHARRPAAALAGLVARPARGPRARLAHRRASARAELDPGGDYIELFFSDTLHLKAWFATVAVVLGLTQLFTAAWIFRKLPGGGRRGFRPSTGGRAASRSSRRCRSPTTASSSSASRTRMRACSRTRWPGAPSTARSLRRC